MMAQCITPGWFQLVLLAHYESDKIISKTSVKHVTCNDHLQANKKTEINEFNKQLDESLSDTDFVLEGKGKFNKMFLDNIKDDENPGIACMSNEYTPSPEEYNNMNVDERPEDDDEDAIDNYLNVELLLNMGTNDKRHGRVIKKTRGLDVEPTVCMHP
jgi:hypothetical protein